MSRLEIPDDIAQRVTSRLKSKKLTIATAESCTGGWLAQTLTSLPGSSEWFRSGFITYSNDSKQDILNVPSKYLCADGPGAVSEEVVRAMVDGAIAVCKTNLAISISGVAGPDGGTSCRQANIPLDAYKNLWWIVPSIECISGWLSWS